MPVNVKNRFERGGNVGDSTAPNSEDGRMNAVRRPGIYGLRVNGNQTFMSSCLKPFSGKIWAKHN
jgi:hypothetical protein